MGYSDMSALTQGIDRRARYIPGSYKPRLRMAVANA